ncbi:hypothetical protein SteCoe_5355 [Stentor coeruleus]|uniref:Anaphase-promoting complex subunit 4-like WD40 domain-containing protein n=1 Tax=Stentor coeruleus TaxID=5963 RepID=A0A1R2CSF2_9CILI|nr:hypothetical protein SteCoe_5355 [Stentor coeruleus]
MSTASTYIASCSTIVLAHDTLNPQPIFHISPHASKVNCVTYNHNSRVLGSSGDDSSIILSHTESGEKLAALEPTSFNPSPINSIAFTSKSELLGCGALDGSVRIWDLRRKEVFVSFPYHTDSVSCVTWNYTDQQLASSSLSGDIALHSMLTKVVIGNFKQRGSAGIKVIQFSPFKKNYLGAGSENGSVYVWDCNTKSVACGFPSFHNSPVTGLAFSAVNHMLMCTGGLDQRINFYDTQEKKIVKTIEADAPLTCISFCTDGYTFAGGTLYGTILIYDLRNPTNPKNVLRGHEGNAVNWVEFAKAKDLRTRPAREQSREGRDIGGNIGRDPGVNIIKDTKEPAVVPTGAVENSANYNRFRTIEEIKLEAKLRVEQKRKEKEKKDLAIQENPEITSSRLPPGRSIPPRPQVDIKDTKDNSKSPLVARDPSPIKPILVGNDTPGNPNLNIFRPSPVLTTTSLEERHIQNPWKPEEKPIQQVKIEDKSPVNAPKNDEKTPSPEINPLEIERTDASDFRNVVELVEKRLNSQDDAIFELREDIQNLHVELIRQFTIQLSEMRTMMSEFSVANSSLLTENQNLREEIERLKKTSY